MKYVLVIITAILLSGCDRQRSESVAGFATSRYTLLCIDGVTYIKVSHGLSVKLDKDSKTVPCKL